MEDELEFAREDGKERALVRRDSPAKALGPGRASPPQGRQGGGGAQEGAGPGRRKVMGSDSTGPSFLPALRGGLGRGGQHGGGGPGSLCGCPGGVWDWPAPVWPRAPGCCRLEGAVSGPCPGGVTSPDPLQTARPSRLPPFPDGPHCRRCCLGEGQEVPLSWKYDWSGGARWMALPMQGLSQCRVLRGWGGPGWA